MPPLRSGIPAIADYKSGQIMCYKTGHFYLLLTLKCSNATQKVQSSAAYCFSTAGAMMRKKIFMPFIKEEKSLLQ
jgi:hypothetical protein